MKFLILYTIRKVKAQWKNHVIFVNAQENSNDEQTAVCQEQIEVPNSDSGCGSLKTAARRLFAQKEQPVEKQDRADGYRDNCGKQ